MNYKYKSEVIASTQVYNMAKNEVLDTPETKEVREVYDKAQAFDKLKREYQYSADNFSDKYRNTFNEIIEDLEDYFSNTHGGL